MGSSDQGNSPFVTVFDEENTFPLTPEDLMAEINTAIANLEYARSVTPSSSSLCHDAPMADEAYKAAGKLDQAFHSLNLSLSKCSPEKASALAKLHSLLSLTSQH